MRARREVCAEILQANPSAYARSFCEGYEAIFAGRDQDAEEAYQAVLAEQPDFALAAILYGEAYEGRNKLDLAEKYYRRAVELQPQRADARFALGSLLFRRGQKEDPKYLPQALEVFREMAEENPSSPDGWNNMGLVLTYMKRFKDAESMFRKAISKNSKDPLLHNNLGALYARENQNDAAEASWLKALALNPSYGEAVVELGALYARTGKLARAVKILQEGTGPVQAPPWGPRIRRNLGFAYLQLGQNDEARQWFQQAAALNTDALAFLGLAHLQMTEGHTDEAVASFEKGAELDSSLARPFVRAWQAQLAAAVSQGNHPAVAGVLGALGGSPPASGGAPSGAVGAEATSSLVAYVLEGWSFEDAENALRQLRATGPDSTSAPPDTAPVPIQKVAAEYSDTAQDLGEEGTVQIMVTVNEQGKVSSAKIQSCEAPIDLCDSALDAARRWKFKPATRYGHPVQASVVLPFRFSKRE
jgi:TonB family protein